MLKATLFIQRTARQSEDDVIRMYADRSHRDMIRIVYSTPELNKDSVVYLPISKAVLYVHDILKSFRYDTRPFEHVQVSTQIHPSVLYHVADLESQEVRDLIEYTVETALRQEIFRARRAH